MIPLGIMCVVKVSSLPLNIKCINKEIKMTNKTESTTISEHHFLKGNALLSLAIGLMFIAEMIEILFEPFINEHAWLDVSLTVFAFIVAIIVLIQIVKTLSVAGGLSKSTFWFGDFNDEYFNHLNLKGYKWAFNILCFILLFLYIFDDLTIIYFDSVTITDFAKFMIGFLFISYSLPVLYLLHKEDSNE